MGKKHSVKQGRGFFSIACIVMAPLLMCGCSQFHATPAFKEANDSFSRGNYRTSLSTYEQIIEKYPSMGDRVLFEMGIVYAYPGNEQKDYQRALGCFQKLIKDYPESRYQHDSERMIFHITNVTMKDERIAEQLTQIENLRQEVKGKGDEIAALQKKYEALEQKAFPPVKGPADKVLIEKSERRMTLISNGKVLTTYRVALGERPLGRKERQGDNKTPEGTYVVDSRNMDSRYHISLHLSYPNEGDKRRAQKLGVSPGGDISIHGIKNGVRIAGDQHPGFDWTKGCIAVTNPEIEEIEKLVPNGTIVEIRP